MLLLNNLRLAPESVPVQLQFAAGQIAVVLGRNNSGKTNLLRLVAGLTTRANGEVYVDEQSLADVSTGQRPVGLVFQAFVNYPHWSARRNIESPLLAKGVDRAERKRRVARIAATLQIEELLDRMPAELSGGQQQQLAIARALATQPKALLLDEPTEGIQPSIIREMARVLKRIRDERQLSILVSEQVLSFAMDIADRILVLENGRIVHEAKREDIDEQQVAAYLAV